MSRLVKTGRIKVPNQNQTCRCGRGKPATFTSGGESFAANPCRQRFYRRTIKAARNGDPAAQAYVSKQGWNIHANIGGKASSKSNPNPAPKSAQKSTSAPKQARAPKA